MNAVAQPSSPAVEISHRYEFRGRELAANLVSTIAVVLLASGICLASLRAGLLPRSAFRADPDSAIIATKAELAQAPGDADICLVGDSSCLINLDVATLQTAQNVRPINLGALSYLSLDSFGLLAGEYSKDKTAPKILLTVHPDCLRTAADSPAHRGVLEGALGRNGVIQLRFNNPVSDRLGFEDLRTRLVDRWVPEPLKGTMGAKYGFTEYIQSELKSRLGTMDETSRFDPQTNSGSAEYRLSQRIKPQAEKFLAHLPKNVRIRVLISPVPKSHAQKGHEGIVRTIRKELETALKAEGPSWELPLILPDDQFGTVTHLLPDAAKQYSQELATRLAEWK